MPPLTPSAPMMWLPNSHPHFHAHPLSVDCDNKGPFRLTTECYKKKIISKAKNRSISNNYIILFIYLYEPLLGEGLGMSAKRFTMAAIALFFGSEQTYCALVVLDSEQLVTGPVHSEFLISYPPKWWVQRCFVTWLVPRETAAIS